MMTQDEYEHAVDKVLMDLMVDVNSSVKDDDVKIEPLSLIRMLVKLDSKPSVRVVRSAMYGLLLSGLPVTDENIRWLIRDNQLGFFEENKLFISGERNGGVSLYPSMNEYKDRLFSIHDECHRHKNK